MGSESVPPAPVRPGDVETVRAATDVLGGQSKKRFFGRLFPFLGPAFIACVAYIDPTTLPPISKAAPSMAICSSGSLWSAT